MKPCTLTIIFYTACLCVTVEAKPGDTFTYEEAVANSTPTHWVSPATDRVLTDEEVRFGKKEYEARLKVQKEQVASLKKELFAAVDDLKAKWFPKRTRVENYDIIAKNILLVMRISDWSPMDEWKSWGLNDLDLEAIHQATIQHNQGNTLDSQIRNLKRENERLSRQIEYSNREMKWHNRELSDEVKMTRYESARAAAAAEDAARNAEDAARNADDAGFEARRNRMGY